MQNTSIYLLFFSDLDSVATSLLHKENLLDNWTCLQMSSVTVKCKTVTYNGEKTQFVMKRHQFPLVECEAMTIHKSQGASFKCVAIHLKQNLTRQLMYVAMSRVTSQKGLFLYGCDSIYPNRPSAERRRKIVNTIKTTSPVNVELDRMRSECPVVDRFEYINIKDHTVN